MNEFGSYFLILLTFLTLWFIGFWSTRRYEGNIKIMLPSWLSRVLFIKILKTKVMIETVLIQLFTYFISTMIVLTYFMGCYSSIQEMQYIYTYIACVSAVIYFIICMIDTIIYSIKQKKG